MNIINRVLNRVRYAGSSKLLVGALFVGLTGVALTANLTGGTPVQAAECKANNIINCGVTSVSDFVNKYKLNEKGDLDNIYTHYGLAPNEIDRFAKTAKMGEARKNGDIVLDGKVVATNATSLGREKKSYSSNLVIDGKTYYSSRSQDVFLSNSIPALIMMNGNQFEFAALTVCGNPITGKPKGDAPKYSCDMLNTKQIDRTTFSYTTDTTALNGAKIAKLVYEFGDGKTETVTNPSQAVTHKYAKEGTYTTKVTVYVTVNGETKTVTGAKCAKPVEVKPEAPKPAYACTALTPTVINKEKREYRFTAKTTQSGGATLKDASFNFGDGQSITGVKPTDASTVASTHTYAKDGTYTIIATVNFNVAGDVKSVTCQTKVTPETPAECKPGIPVGDERCKEECKPGIPVGDKRCEDVPAELPNTGVTDVLGGTIGLGGVLTAGGYFIRSRRNLLDSFLNR